jgi:hypothetical protein
MRFGMNEQESYNKRLIKEVEVRRRARLLDDEQLDDLLELLRRNDGKPFNERTIRPEHGESNHVD